ncbi:MAG: hemolysin family protein [Candidatus Sumerlaeota bacterium]|nr:hemolysin family protein [Candidatus Sumerlaeota bacterium]
MRVEIEILVLLLLILGNGVFAAAEVAIIYSRKVRLKQRARQGDKRARVALDLSASPERFLSTVQVGISLVGVFAGVFGGATIAKRLEDVFHAIPVLAPYAEPIAMAAVVVPLTYLSLIFGELVPKRMALSNAEGIAVILARPMRFLSKIGSPAVTLLTVSTGWAMKLLRIKATTEPGVTEEELRHMIQQATNAGVLVRTEQEIVERALQLGDRQVTAFMTPRPDITFLNLDDTPEENWKKIVENRVACYLVCRESLDEVVGVLTRDSLWDRHSPTAAAKLESLMTPPLFVPERVPALRVLDLMKNTRQTLAVVLDEYGGVSGLVTLDDFTSAVLLGRRSQAMEAEPMAVQREDGSWLLSGMMPIEEFRLLFRLETVPDDDLSDYDTLGGFVMNSLGRIPAVADTFERGDLRIEVVDMDSRRVDKLLVQRIPKKEGAVEEGEEKETKEEA